MTRHEDLDVSTRDDEAEAWEDEDDEDESDEQAAHAQLLRELQFEEVSEAQAAIARAYPWAVVSAYHRMTREYDTVLESVEVAASSRLVSNAAKQRVFDALVNRRVWWWLYGRWVVREFVEGRTTWMSAEQMRWAEGVVAKKGRPRFAGKPHAVEGFTFRGFALTLLPAMARKRFKAIGWRRLREEQQDIELRAAARKGANGERAYLGHVEQLAKRLLRAHPARMYVPGLLDADEFGREAVVAALVALRKGDDLKRERVGWSATVRVLQRWKDAARKEAKLEVVFTDRAHPVVTAMPTPLDVLLAKEQGERFAAVERKLAELALSPANQKWLGAMRASTTTSGVNFAAAADVVRRHRSSAVRKRVSLARRFLKAAPEALDVLDIVPEEPETMRQGKVEGEKGWRRRANCEVGDGCWTQLEDAPGVWGPDHGGEENPE